MINSIGTKIGKWDNRNIDELHRYGRVCGVFPHSQFYKNWQFASKSMSSLIPFHEDDTKSLLYWGSYLIYFASWIHQSFRSMRCTYFSTVISLWFFLTHFFSYSYSNFNVTNKITVIQIQILALDGKRIWLNEKWK